MSPASRIGASGPVRFPCAGVARLHLPEHPFGIARPALLLLLLGGGVRRRRLRGLMHLERQRAFQDAARDDQLAHCEGRRGGHAGVEPGQVVQGRQEWASLRDNKILKGDAAHQIDVVFQPFTGGQLDAAFDQRLEALQGKQLADLLLQLALGVSPGSRWPPKRPIRPG